MPALLVTVVLLGILCCNIEKLFLVSAANACEG